MEEIGTPDEEKNENASETSEKEGKKKQKKPRSKKQEEAFLRAVEKRKEKIALRKQEQDENRREKIMQLRDEETGKLAKYMWELLKPEMDNFSTGQRKLWDESKNEFHTFIKSQLPQVIQPVAKVEEPKQEKKIQPKELFTDDDVDTKPSASKYMPVKQFVWMT